MTGGDWRERKRDATRQRLSDAAFELFEDRGYDATPVSDVAVASWVSVPTFYMYFADKEHVVLPPQDHDWIVAVLESTPADQPLPERIRLGLQTMIASLPPESHAELLRRWRLVLTVPVLRRRSMEREMASAQVLLEHLGVDPTSSDGAADTVVVAACMNASTTSFLRWAAGDGERSLAQFVDEAFEALRSI
ncbi:MAG: transcriptional regulator, TetR family [Klenkia sp.]|nr:transcriptional regulator, TetR family [Klenkia sp.]